MTIRVLGIDPSLNNVGFGIIEMDDFNGQRDKVDNYGIFNINSRDTTEQKLLHTFNKMSVLLDKYEIDIATIEMNYHNRRRARGAMKCREAIGALKVAIAQKNIPLYSYAPQEIKLAAAGNGRAEKIDIALSVADHFNIDIFEVDKLYYGKMKKFELNPEELVAKKLDHVTDALAIAWCYRLLTLNNTIEKGAG